MKRLLQRTIGSQHNTAGDDDADVGGQQLIGAIMVLGASFLTVLGLNFQKWSLIWAKHNGNLAWYKNFRWMLSFGIYVVGQVVDAASHGYGGQALLVTLTVVAVAMNAIIAQWLFHEPFTWLPKPERTPTSFQDWLRNPFKILYGWDLFSVVLCIAGIGISAVFAPKPPPFTAGEGVNAPKAENYSTYFCCAGKSIIWLAYLALLLAAIVATIARVRNIPREKDKTSKQGGILFGCLCSMTGTISVTFSGPAVHMLKNEFAGDGQLGSSFEAWLYIIFLFVFAASTIVSLNIGLKRYPATIVYPIYSVLGAVLADIAAILYYQTYTTVTAGDLVLFFVGLIIGLAGVGLLLGHQERDAEAEQEKFRKGAERLGQLGQSFRQMSSRRLNVSSRRDVNADGDDDEGPRASMGFSENKKKRQGRLAVELTDSSTKSTNAQQDKKAVQNPLGAVNEGDKSKDPVVGRQDPLEVQEF